MTTKLLLKALECCASTTERCGECPVKTDREACVDVLLREAMRVIRESEHAEDKPHPHM